MHATASSTCADVATIARNSANSLPSSDSLPSRAGANDRASMALRRSSRRNCVGLVRALQDLDGIESTLSPAPYISVKPHNLERV